MTKTKLTIRHPRPEETLPPELVDAYDLLYGTDCDWIWLAEYEDKVVGRILTHNMNGILLILRMNATTDAPKSWAVVTLRYLLREAGDRGMLGFLTMLQDTKPQEVKLMRIVQRNGGVLLPFSGALAFGKLEVRG